MAGGGIRISNVRNVALRTGIREVHTSLSTQVRSTAYDGGAEGDTLHGSFTRFLLGTRRARLQVGPACDFGW